MVGTTCGTAANEALAFQPSVVIPAHNEEMVISRCLAALATPGAIPHLDVHVICNGTTDHTGPLAERVGSETGLRVTVHNVKEASKSAALRHSSEVVHTTPRIYLDADVELSGDDALAIAKALANQVDARVAGSTIDLRANGSSRVVKAWARAWERQAYARSGVVGSGLYAVNKAGLERIRRFPPLLNDDAWVLSQFSDSERMPNIGRITAYAPESLWPLVRRRARVRIGNQELAGRTPVQPGQRTRASRNSARGVGPSGLAALALVALSARALAAWRALVGTRAEWSTDRSSRAAATQGSGR